MSVHEECGVFGVMAQQPEDVAGLVCFTGEYPTAIPADTRKDRFERRLSE